MKRKIKYGKIIIVVFITVLIWVWADLALDEPYPVPTVVTIRVVQTNPDEFWVSFSEKPSVSLEELILKGPVSKTDKLDRELKAGGGSRGLEFSWYPEKEAMERPGYNLDVLNFLNQSKQIRQHGLTVELAKPKTIPVSVYKLVQKSLKVRCVDDDESAITDAVIDPATVEMFVPEDWQGERLIAKVRLASSEIRHARSAAIEKTPYIELASGEIRKSSIAVRITLPPEQERLRADTVQNVTHGFLLSENLKDGLQQGRYEVEVENLSEVIGAIRILATPEAKLDYENMRYQVILEIDEKDTESTEPIKRPLIYNFPPGRRDEIKLNQLPVEARFRLIRLSPAESVSTVGQ